MGGSVQPSRDKVVQVWTRAHCSPPRILKHQRWVCTLPHPKQPFPDIYSLCLVGWLHRNARCALAVLLYDRSTVTVCNSG